MRNGKMGIETRGLQATAVLTCNGNPDCVAAGLDGAQMQMQQNLQIVIDVIGAGVMNGRSRTTLIIRDQNGETELAGTLIPGSSGNLQWQSIAGSGTLSR